MSRVVCIIQARLGSTRLPGKALLELAGRPLIRHVVDRALLIRGVDQVVVATPSHHDAMLIGDAVRTLDVPVVWYPRIAENDVLARYALAAIECNAAVVMRVTGDCPLVDPDICTRVLQLYRETRGCQYASNIAQGYVDGEDCEVFSCESLLSSAMHAVNPEVREHVTMMMRAILPLATLRPDEDRSMLKTSVDTLEDFQRVQELLAHV